MKGMINFHRITRERQRQGKQPKGTRKRQQRRQRILNRQFLIMTETMQDTAKALHALAPASPTNDPAQEPDETDILSVLYSGDYFPKSHMSIKDDLLDKNARKTQEALRATFSPEQGKDKNFHTAGQKRRAIATGDQCRLLRRLPKPPVLFAAASYCCAIKTYWNEQHRRKKGPQGSSKAKKGADTAPKKPDFHVYRLEKRRRKWYNNKKCRNRPVAPIFVWRDEIFCPFGSFITRRVKRS